MILKSIILKHLKMLTLACLDFSQPAPIDTISMDFCQYAGQNLLMVANRCSDYIMVAAAPDQTTDTALKYLQLLINTYSYPSEVRSDSSQAFRAKFEEKLRRLGINHYTSWRPIYGRTRGWGSESLPSKTWEITTTKSQCNVVQD